MLNEEKTILDIIDELEEHQKAFFEFMKENNLKYTCLYISISFFCAAR